MKLSHDISKFIDYIPYEKISSGWWLSHPSEKYESQLGLFFPIDGTLKKKQTTNQKNIIKISAAFMGPLQCRPCLAGQEQINGFPSENGLLYIILSTYYMYIRRPRPLPRQGRRLGPPEVWNLALSVKPSKPSKRLFGSPNPAINSFFLAFKPAGCQPSKAPNPPNAFLAAPTPQAKAPRHHQ